MSVMASLGKARYSLPLYEAEKEMGGKRVPTLMLYGRVCERMPMSKDRFQSLLSELVGRGVPLR